MQPRLALDLETLYGAQSRREAQVLMDKLQQIENKSQKDWEKAMDELQDIKVSNEALEAEVQQLRQEVEGVVERQGGLERSCGVVTQEYEKRNRAARDQQARFSAAATGAGGNLPNNRHAIRPGAGGGSLSSAEGGQIKIINPLRAAIRSDSSTSRESRQISATSSRVTEGFESEEDEDDDLDVPPRTKPQLPTRQQQGTICGEGDRVVDNGHVNIASKQMINGRASQMVILPGNLDTAKPRDSHAQKGRSEVSLTSAGDSRAKKRSRTRHSSGFDELSNEWITKKVTPEHSTRLIPTHDKVNEQLAPNKQTLPISRKEANNGKSQLPRLKQGTAPLFEYYKIADKAFSKYNHQTDEDQHDFVNHFLNGIHNDVVRNKAIAELQIAQDSTIMKDKPWIRCDWGDVFESLVDAGLLERV